MKDFFTKTFIHFIFGFLLILAVALMVMDIVARYLNH